MSDSAIVRVNCKPGRIRKKAKKKAKKKARYWTMYRRREKEKNENDEKIFCHLQITWPGNEQWEVAFVDTGQDMAAWMNNYATDCLMFDCEWSPWQPVGVGVIQFATPLPNRQVLVVDGTRVSLEKIQSIFNKYLMVGWAIGNGSNGGLITPHGDLKQLGLDLDSNKVDLQLLTADPPPNMNEEDRILIENYQPMNRHGDPHNQSWSLNDMANCFLGYTVKVPLKKDDKGEDVHPKWGDPSRQLKDKDIHYAANDVIAVAYIYDKLKYIYEPPAMEKKATFNQWACETKETKETKELWSENNMYHFF